MQTKTILTAFLLLFCIFSFAQKAKLSKEETVKYINDLYKDVYSVPDTDYEVVSVTLDRTVLVIIYSNKDKYRRELLKSKIPLTVEEQKQCGYFVIGDGTLLGCINSKEDAIRLKNALEHLISIIKNDKDIDPFAN